MCFYPFFGLMTLPCFTALTILELVNIFGLPLGR